MAQRLWNTVGNDSADLGELGVPEQESARLGEFGDRIPETVRLEITEEFPAGQGEHGGLPAGTADRPLILLLSDSTALVTPALSAIGLSMRTVRLGLSSGAVGAPLQRVDTVVVELPGSARPDDESLVHILQACIHVGTPVVVLTEDKTTALELALLERGVSDVVQAPFDRRVLRARLQHQVRQKRAVHRATRGQLATLDALEAAESHVAKQKQLRNDFLRMMAHELKTPLTAILLQLRLLDRSGDDTSTPLRTGLGRIHRSSVRLVHLVDAFMEWARAESDRAHVTPSDVQLQCLLEEVFEELQPFAQQKNLRLQLDVDSGTTLRTDRRITRLLLLSLVSRAIQITESGTVSVEVRHQDEDHVAVVLHDGATALSSIERDEIFQLIPSDLAVRSGSGSGLGLRVVQDIARVLGADVVLGAPCRSGNDISLILPIHLPAA